MEESDDSSEEFEQSPPELEYTQSLINSSGMRISFVVGKIKEKPYSGYFYF